MPHTTSSTSTSRDSGARDRYRRAALGQVPRLLGSLDRNPYRPTYGCFDRQYWHYRTACFPSEMYQEGVLPLALVYAHAMPDNPWYGNPRVKELAIAALRFAARSSHRDGSCDDYYPFERALGAAVFSLQAAARAYQLLHLEDADLEAWLCRRADWIAAHDESGRLTNHHALAALGLFRVAEITDQPRYREAADTCLDRVLHWQDAEGWFQEYDGADPGYQTVTIDCLAKIFRATGDLRLRDPLERAVAFSHHFLHPDGSYAGEYGSRGTYHFYPHGMELLTGEDPRAADLADGFLTALATGREGRFDDDRLYVHRLGNLLEAYLDWSPRCPPLRETGEDAATTQYFSRAGLLVHRDDDQHTVISTARGGIVKHFARLQAKPRTDAGLLVETTDGRLASSQQHHHRRDVTYQPAEAGRQGTPPELCTVAGPLYWATPETVSPLKQSILHLGMWTVGRWCRTLVRRLLQRRLITGERPCPIRLHRAFTWREEDDFRLCITDTIELLDDRLQVARMAFGVDHQTAYVAASGVYQDGVLQPWTDLAEYVPILNRDRRVVITRTW